MGRDAQTKRRTTRISRRTELDVYRLSFDLAMKLFTLSRAFPESERYSLTSQMRRASRSVCANIAEAWRKRWYEAAFVSKLSDSEAEAAECQVWIEFAVKCLYVPAETARTLYGSYDQVISKLVTMISRPKDWVLP